MFHHFQVITAHRHERISSRTMPPPKARISPSTLSLRIRWSIIQRANRFYERTVTISRSVRRRNTRLWKYDIDFAPRCNNFRFKTQESLTRASRRKALPYRHELQIVTLFIINIIWLFKYSFNKDVTRAYETRTSLNSLLNSDTRMILYLSFIE